MSLTALKELVVLSTIRAHPLHGYALVDALNHGLGWTVGLTRPTVYATLRRFVERGWIEGETTRDTNYPERVIYSITDQGEQAHHDLLQRCIDNLTEGTHPVAALLAQLDGLEQSKQQNAIKTLLTERKHRLQMLKAFPAHEGLAGRALTLLCQQVQSEVEILEEIWEEDTS